MAAYTVHSLMGTMIEPGLGHPVVLQDGRPHAPPLGQPPCSERLCLVTCAADPGLEHGVHKTTRLRLCWDDDP